MQQFKTAKDGFRELRNKLLIGIISAYAIGVVIVLYMVTASKEEIENSWVFTLILITPVLGFSTFRNIKRQKRMFESFRLTITDEAVIREQLNTPTITLPRSSVREITRTPSGIYCIIGKSKLNAIGIPAQIENREDLDRALSEIKPITVKTLGYQYLQAGALLLIFIATGMGLLSEDRIILTISGIAICALLVYGFIIIQRSKNFDRRMKRMSYITIIPFLAILANVIFQWMEA